MLALSMEEEERLLDPCLLFVLIPLLVCQNKATSLLFPCPYRPTEGYLDLGLASLWEGGKRGTRAPLAPRLRQMGQSNNDFCTARSLFLDHFLRGEERQGRLSLRGRRTEGQAEEGERGSRV